MKNSDAQKQIAEVVESYERMLKLSMEKGQTFDSAPYTLSLQALNKMLEKENND